MRILRLIVPLLFSYLAVSMVADAEDLYFTATGQEDGKPLIFRSIAAVPEEVSKRALPYLITVSWRYEPTTQGMPSSEVNEAQIEFEDALSPLDRNKIGRQMLVVTGNGHKDWYWYVKDPDAWKTQAEHLVERSTYPISITTTDDRDWSLYENFKASVKGL